MDEIFIVVSEWAEHKLSNGSTILVVVHLRVLGERRLMRKYQAKMAFMYLVRIPEAFARYFKHWMQKRKGNNFK